MESPSNRSALFIVFLVVFIDLLGFGIVLPLLPIYAVDLLVPLFPGDATGPRLLRGGVLAVLMASFSLMQFIFAPVWGRVSDRLGRRPILLLGLAGSVVFYTLFGIASELGAGGHLRLGLALMLVSRLGAGVAGATISTAQAVIADVTPADRRRARGMALIGVAFGIGFTFGPLLGFTALFTEFAGAPGFAAAAFSLIALALAVARLPETWRSGAAKARRRWLDWRATRAALATPVVGRLIVTFFLATVAFGGLETTLALVNRLLLTGEATATTELTRQTLMASEAARHILQRNFLVFAYVGFVLMLAQGFLYRRLVQRVGEVRFLKAGAVLLTVGLGGAVAVLAALDRGAPASGLMLTCALAVFTLAVMGFAFLTPSVNALISRHTDPANQGEILGVNQSASALARIVGPSLALPLFFVTPSHVLPYVASLGLLGLVLFLNLGTREA